MNTNDNNKKSIERDFVKIAASFRDPSGYLFIKKGILYRNITQSYRKHYDYAKESGLYKSLIDDELLISHSEIDDDFKTSSETYKILRPERISFISYPYEWCFSELKDAALLTLEIQKRAIEANMILKDASAFNVQFKNGKPIFIDTLSFEKYKEDSPWIGYRQFCQHFLAPLTLMKYKDLRLNQFLRIFIDGIPLDITSSLLPLVTMISPSTFFHIHLHAKSQKRFSNRKKSVSLRMPRRNLIALIDNLKSAVNNLRLKKQDTEWQNYYDNTNYSSDSFLKKKKIISEFLNIIKPKNVWDLGANTGVFSRIASDIGIETISFDIDPLAVENNYLEIKKRNEKNIFPLILDLTNPSPGIGWGNEERTSLEKRGPTDTVLALALVHHLVISNNLPFKKIAEYFSKLCKNLIIEFIPKTDSQVQRLLVTRKDIFTHYYEENFEEEFRKYFLIKLKKNIIGSERKLYLMCKKEL